VGEPINPEAWMWYHRVIGGKRCPIVDTWWQTETGGIMITPLPGETDTVPGSATRAFPGIDADVLDDAGRPVAPPNGGFLAVRRPWPGMLRGIWGDSQRYRETYWSRWENPTYFPGDGAHRDARGYFWIMGRIDDVMNVSGHRIGTMEVESAIVAHPDVAEAAVVGRPDDLTGTAIVAFVTARAGVEVTYLREGVRDHVAKMIGPIAKPADVRFTDALPKTRSGKIMRRLLRDIASGKKTVGDTTTLEDLSVLARLREAEEA
jgi:acetyl-CoA synthetase